MILTLGPANLSTEFNFSIPENKEKIYVYLSGGLDSAALLCLILTELKNTDRLNSTTVVCFTVVKNDGSTFYAKRIIEQIAKLFDKEIQHENNITNDVYNFKKGTGAKYIEYMGEWDWANLPFMRQIINIVISIKFKE
jgi:tRNA(Ile)-lysidine synthase TilS/MesJ